MEYIDRFGLLGPQLTLGHGVWLNEADIDRLAATGTCVCHNCSSNFRLRSGVAALNVFEAKGINTAIGLDEAGINDDRDMLQEMRMVLRAHRVPGMARTTCRRWRRCCAWRPSGGAKTTAFGERLGMLEVGQGGRHGADRLGAASTIPISTSDADAGCGDAARQERRASRTVICDGEVIYQDGKFTKVDRDGALKALHDDLQQGAGGRRGGAPQAVEGAAAACADVLRQLFRPVAA